MAKYVCDFDTIRADCEVLDNKLAEMETNLNSNKNSLESDLVSWSGQASTAYKSSSEGITSTIQQEIETMKAMSSYIKDSVSKIEEAENSLAALKF